MTKEAIEDFMESLEEALSQPNDDLMTVVQRLKSQGLKTGLLTNNWASPDGRSLLLKVSQGSRLAFSPTTGPRQTAEASC